MTFVCTDTSEQPDIVVKEVCMRFPDDTKFIYSLYSVSVGMQAAALGCSVAIAMVGGAFTGQ